jgi:superoxide dismutase, Cu-Zn family
MTKRLTLAFSMAVLLGTVGCDDDPDAPKDAGATSDTGASPDGATTGDAPKSDTVVDSSLGVGTLGNSTGPFVAYPDPFANGTANPAVNIVGSAKADGVAGATLTLTLEVSGMPKNTTFGSHLHKLACTDNKAGGHYQHNPAPNADAGGDAGGPADPTYANPSNEAWLDFTTDANGKGLGTTTVSWVPAMANAKAIIVHAMPTGDGGLAGAKLACLPFAFK